MAENLTSSQNEAAQNEAAPRLRLLGFVPAQAASGLAAALDAVAGPPVAAHPGPDGVAALLQPEPAAPPLLARDRAALLAGLHTLQRRLEVACQAGPFLPADPAAACCPAAALDGLLAPAWAALPGLLAELGRQHQWDVVLAWAPEPVLAARREQVAQAAAGLGRSGLADAVAAVLRAERARREAALLEALTPAVLAMAPGGAVGGPTELALTVLLPAGGEAAVEAALEALDAADDTSTRIDLRGPLPPLGFHAVRVVEIDAAGLAAAWRHLDLPPRIDLARLHRHWRARAFALHPDRHGAAEAPGFAAALSEATAAYHLLRDLVRHPEGAEYGLPDLLRAVGHRLLLPALPGSGSESGSGSGPESARAPGAETLPSRREAALALP